MQIDLRERGLHTISAALGATEKQVDLAFARALGRTATTLKKLAQQAFKSEIDARRVAYIRERLKGMKPRKDRAGLWFGLNDMPVSKLRGRSSDRRPLGAMWSGKLGSYAFPKGFIIRHSRSGLPASIYSRTRQDRYPIDEAKVPIKERMDRVITRDVFREVEDIFWGHFMRDLQARVNYRIGAR